MLRNPTSHSGVFNAIKTDLCDLFFQVTHKKKTSGKVLKPSSVYCNPIIEPKTCGGSPIRPNCAPSLVSRSTELPGFWSIRNKCYTSSAFWADWVQPLSIIDRGGGISCHDSDPFPAALSKYLNKMYKMPQIFLICSCVKTWAVVAFQATYIFWGEMGHELAEGRQNGILCFLKCICSGTLQSKNVY